MQLVNWDYYNQENTSTPEHPFQAWWDNSDLTESRIRGIATELSRLVGIDLNTYKPDELNSFHDMILLTLFLGSRS